MMQTPGGKGNHRGVEPRRPNSRELDEAPAVGLEERRRERGEGASVSDLILAFATLAWKDHW